MRHAVFGRKLSRTKNERRRLLQSLARELIEHGTVTTTRARAKAVQPLVEKLVTKAKKGGNAALTAIERVLADRRSKNLLLSDASTRFGNRTSGFTRIIKLGPRRGDASEKVSMQFVDERIQTTVVARKQEEKSTKEIKQEGKKKTTKRKLQKV